MYASTSAAPSSIGSNIFLRSVISKFANINARFGEYIYLRDEQQFELQFMEFCIGAIHKTALTSDQTDDQRAMKFS